MATTLEDFNALAPELSTLQESDCVSVNMPFKHYLQETMLEYQRIIRHRAFLEQNGMDFSVIERIPTIINACREIFSQCSMINFPTPGSKKEWEIAKEEADLLLYDLKVSMDYAFRNHPELLKRVSVIREGSSNADFIQDLTDAYVLSRENRALLEAARYEVENIERASKLSQKLSELLAMATLDKSSSPEMRINRDKCFTILKKTIDEAIKQARFIYRHDKATASQFMVNPPAKKKGNSKNEGEEKA